MKYLDADTEQEWLENRKLKITGTFAGYIVGEGHTEKNPKELKEIFLNGEEKEFTEEQKEKINFGKKAEDSIRELFALEYDVEVEHVPFRLYLHEEEPRLAASIDGIIINKNGYPRIFECKTISVFCKDKWLLRNSLDLWRKSPPKYYSWQMIHYLLVTGISEGIMRAYFRILCRNENCENITTCTQRNRKYFRDFYFNSQFYKDAVNILYRREIAFLKAIDEGKLPTLPIKGI